MSRRVGFKLECCGLGDAALHFWHAQGYRGIGVEPYFHTERQDSAHVALARIFGFGDCISGRSEDRDSAITTGNYASHYAYELREDKGANPRALVWASKLPYNPPPVRPPFLESELDLAAAGDAAASLTENHTRPLVLMFPFAEFTSRMYPLALWNQVCWSLVSKHCRVVVMVDSKERFDQCAHFDFRYYGMPWKFVAAMMLHANLVLGQDSGAPHVAATLGVRTLALMGPTSGIFTHADDCCLELRAAKERAPCVGCHFRGERGYKAACDSMCAALTSLSPWEVADTAMRWMSHPLYERGVRRQGGLDTVLAAPPPAVVSAPTHDADGR